MRKLVKRLLACCLVFALALTMLCGVGAISASAASTGTLTVESQKINPETATATVPVVLATDHSVGFAMATYTVALPEALQDKLIGISVASDSEVNPAILSYKDTTGEKVTVNEGSTAAFVAPAIDDGEFQVALNATSVLANGPKSITVNLTFDTSSFAALTTKAYDEFAIATKDVVACDNGLSGASYDIQYIDVASVNGALTVNYLVIAAKNGYFGADFSLMFAVNKALVDNTGAKLMVTKEGQSAYEVLPDAKTQTVKSAVCYVYYVKDIQASTVIDSILTTLVVDNYEGETLDYNLVDYAESRIEKASKDAEKKYCAAFLEYAAAAQQRFDHKTTTLADVNVPSNLKKATSVNLASQQSAIVAKTVYVSNFNVRYRSQVEMMAAVKFGATNLNGYKITFTYQGAQTPIYETTLADAEQQTISGAAAKVVYCNTIEIRDMVKVVDIKVINNSGTVVDTAQYSFLTYAYNKRANTDGPVSYAMMAFAKAFAIYKGDTVTI